MAQSVKRPTLDFSSGHDLRVCGLEPRVKLCTVSAEPAWDSLSPSLPLPCLRALGAHALSQNRQTFKKKSVSHDL